jgi:hypothetical protein
MARYTLTKEADGTVGVDATVRTRDAVPFYGYSPRLAPQDVRSGVVRLANLIAQARRDTRVTWAEARKAREVL